MLGQFLSMAISRRMGARTFGKRVLIAWAIGLYASTGFALTNAWTGLANDGLWSSPANWALGVPTSSDDVVIALPGVYTVVLDMNATINSLTLGAGASPLDTATLDLGSSTLQMLGGGNVYQTGRLRIGGSGSASTKASSGKRLPVIQLNNYGEIRVEGGTLNIVTYNVGKVEFKGTCHVYGDFTNATGAEVKLVGSTIGHGVLNVDTPSLGFDNDGDFIMDSEGPGQGAFLNINDSFNNRSGNFFCRDSLGQGGARVINARFANTNTATISYPLRIEGSDFSHINTGTLLLLAELVVQQSGTSPRFTNGGDIQLDNANMAIHDGIFDNAGGGFSVVVRKRLPALNQVLLQNCTIEGSLTNNVDMILDGCNLPASAGLTNAGNLWVHNTLVVNTMASFNNNSGAHLYIEGNSDGLANLVLNLSGGTWTNNGFIHLTSNANAEARLTINSGSLSNAGTIQAEAGAGGLRTINTVFSNQGTLAADTDLLINGAGNYLNDTGGLIQINAGTTQVDLQSPGDLFRNENQIQIQAGAIFHVRNGHFSTNGTIAKRGGGSGLLFLEDMIIENTNFTNQGNTSLAKSTIDGSATIVNQGTLIIKGNVPVNGTLTNSSGTIIIEATSFGDGRLYIPADWTNDGNIELTDISINDAIIEVVGTLTNNGTIEANMVNGGERRIVAELNNQNIIDVHHNLTIEAGADVDHVNYGTITVDGGYCLASMSSASTFTNNSGASIQSTAPGAFRASGGTFVQNGSISAKTKQMLGSTPTFVFSSISIDGTLSISNGVNALLHDTTVLAGAVLDNSGSLAVRGTFICHGSFSNNSVGFVEILSTSVEGPAAFNLDNSTTNDGTMVLSDTNSFATDLSCLGTFTNNGLLQCQSGAGGTRTLQLVLNNVGTLETVAPTILEFPLGSASNSGEIDIVSNTLAFDMDYSATFVNSGEIHIHPGAVLSAVGPGLFDFDGGTVDDGAIVVRDKLGATPAIYLDDLNVDGSLENHFDLHLKGTYWGTGSQLDNYGNVSATGTNTLDGYANRSGSFLNLTGDSFAGNAQLTMPNLDNWGTVTVHSDNGTNTATLNLSGMLSNHADSTVIFSGSTSGFPHVLIGAVTNDGLLSFRSETQVRVSDTNSYNSGLIEIYPNWTVTWQDLITPSPVSSISNLGEIRLGSASDLYMVSSVISNRYSSPDRGLISGNGTITQAAAPLNSHGGIAPGASPGELEIVGNLDLQGDGITHIDVAGAVQGVSYDHLVVSGTANLAGELNILLSYVPTEGETFTIIEAGSVSGTFATVTGADVGNGLVLVPNYTATSVVLEAVAGSIHWINAAGGFWSDPSNWNPAQVPGPCSFVTIDTPGTYTVMVDQDVEVYNLTLGNLSTGTQTIDSQGYDIQVQDASLIRPHGELILHDSILGESVATCVALRGQNLLALAGLTNQGLIMARGKAVVSIPLGNTGLGTITVQPFTGEDASLLIDYQSLLNEGLIELSDSGGLELAQLRLNQGTLTNNGSLVVTPGSSTREIITPLVNAGPNGEVLIQGDAMLDPVQIGIRPTVTAFLQPDEATLVRYSMDETEGDQLSDAAALGLDLEAVGQPTQGAFYGGRFLDGVDDELPMTDLRATLHSQANWTLGWFSRSPDASTPALQPLPQFFSAKDRNLTDGLWHHFDLAWDGAALALYRDGQLSNTIAANDAADFIDKLRIGYEDGRFVAGTIDDLCIRTDVPTAESLGKIAEMVEIANDRARSAQVNDPDGIQQIWIDGQPVGVIGTSADGLLLFSRKLDPSTAQAFNFATNDGRMGHFAEAALEPVAGEPFTWLLRASREATKGTPNTYYNQATLAFSGGHELTLPEGVLYNTGTISGTGQLTVSDATFQSDGTIAPGASAGSLTVVGDLTLLSNSALQLEIGGAAPGTGYDQLAVSGNLDLAGSLTANLINSYAPSGGEIFSLVTFATHTGSFTSTTIPPDTGSVDYQSATTSSAFQVEAVPISSYSINPLTYSVPESATVKTAATITVERSGNLTVPGEVTIATVDIGEATADADYTSLNQVLSFAANQASQTVSVNIIDDPEIEGDEDLQLQLSSPTAGSIGNGTATLTIIDVEQGALALTSGTYSVSENGGTLSVTVERTGGSDGNVSIHLGSFDGSATAGPDFDFVDTTLSWTNGDTSPRNFTVVINDDFDLEGDENFVLQLTNATGGASIGALPSAIVTITDYEEGAISFSAPTFSVAENGVNATIQVERVGGTDGTLSATFYTQDDTATAGDDYTAVSQFVSYTDGQSAAQTITVPILDDSTYEGDETVLLNLGPLSKRGTAITVAQLTIEENDSPPGVFDLGAASYSVSEGAGSLTVTVFRSVGSGGTVTVDFETFDSGGGATAGNDYTAVTTTLSFGPTVTSQDVVIPILEDSDIESGESFGIRIQNPTGGASLGTTSTGNVLIQDNDNPPGTLALVSSTFTVTEGGGSLNIGVSRTGGSGGVVSVTASTVAGGTATPDLDYTTSSLNIKWDDGESDTRFLTVPILDDNQAEPTEVFGVVLNNVVGATLGTASGSVSIIDNDSNPAGVLTLAEPTYTAQENGGMLHFQVLRSGGSGGRVSVQLATVDNSAQAGSDYTALRHTVVFEDFDTAPKTFDLPIINDTNAEGNETLLLVLSSPSGGATLGANPSARVTIVDDEGLRVQWTSNSQRRAEANQTTLVTASLDSPSDSEVRVGVIALANGNATQGADYELAESELVFEPGATIATLAVEIRDDQLVEGEENFFLQLHSNFIAVGSPDTMELVIADNDTAQVNWSLVPDAAQEGSLTKADNTFAVQATLTNALERGGSVPLTTAGSADSGLDYAAPPQIVFAPGERTGTAAITLFDDNIAEHLETLILTLGAGNMIATGANRVATMNLLDDDLQRAYVSWTLPNTRVEEDNAKRKDTSVTVEAFLSNPFSHNVTVNYQVAGLAAFGDDHNLRPGTLNFPAGTTTATLSFDVLGDNRQEADENVAIRLQSGGVRPGLRDTHNVIIVDNDENQVPDTIIQVVAPDTYLAGVLQVERGNNLSLVGLGTDPQGDTEFRYQWEICLTGNCPQFEGRTLEQTLTRPGTYLITCFAIDRDGNRDPTPAELRVQVRENIPPTVAIVQPSATNLDIPVGQTVTFIGEASDKHKRDVASTNWFIQGDEANLTTNTLTYAVSFDEPGDYTVVFEASDGLATASDSRSIHVYQGTAPPRPVILHPSPGSVFERGESLVCEGDVIGGDGKREGYAFRWDYGDGTWQDGRTATRKYDEPGNYQIRLFVNDDQGNRIGSQVVQVSVVDPEASPSITFGFPSGMQVQPGSSKREGACVFLNSIVLDNMGYKDLSFVYDVPGAQLNHETPGLICFPEEGEYTVSLYAVSPAGVQSNVETRTIVVKTTEDSQFEPNDTIYDAISVLPGIYANLGLDDDDPEDYFRVTLDGAGQRLVITADIQGEGFIQVLDQFGRAVGEPRHISGRDNINLTGLDPGDYYVRIYQPDANKRKALGLSLSIGVLNPTLYIPDVRSDSTHATSIGIVNPTGEVVCAEAVGFAADGTIIDEIPVELMPRGRRHFTTEELFGNLASSVAWVQIDAVGELVGYANTESRDRKELYGISANRELRSELHVPHIAEKTDQWYTRAALINGSSGGIDVRIETPDKGADAELGGAFTKDSFEFVDRLDGLSAQSLWASIHEQQGEPNIAGIEVFGTLDGNRVSAGLELADVRRDNPNFTFVRNNLYFTHIARDATFYTGLALVNLGSFQQNIVIHAYRANGSEVGNGLAKTLDANAKLVANASSLLAEMNTTTAEVDWLYVEADADITGFELFGSSDGKQLAGLEATRGLREQICYPFIDTSPDTRHGISAVNVNDTPITVNFTLYRNDGVSLGTTSVTLQAHQKFARQLELMFPNLAGEVPGWLEAASSVTGKPLAGFELYLNATNGEQMGAIVAE